ncbi:MAG: hypothetical protein GXP62_06750, partial [Oligoflexia bacterium]|nr:hypothetical protein [Oligoflexia bacterium]
AGVFGQGPAGLVSLVQAGHPLLAAPGLPRTTPGVLTLDSVALDWIIGVPMHVDQSLEGRGLPDILVRCGVRT